METLVDRLINNDIEKIWLENDRDTEAISKKYNTSTGTVYGAMRKYCSMTGKRYPDYLRQPHKRHKKHKKHVFTVSPKRNTPIGLKSSEEEMAYIGELLRSRNDGDVLEGINLLISKIEKEINQNGSGIIY